MSIDQENVAAVANTAFPASEEPEMKKSRCEESTEKPQEGISADENKQQVSGDVLGKIEKEEEVVVDNVEGEDVNEEVQDDNGNVEVEGDNVEIEDEQGEEGEAEMDKNKDELIEKTTE
jgi:hypothetical protein